MHFFEMSGNRHLVHHALDLGNRLISITGVHFDLVTTRTGKFEASHSLVLPNGAPTDTTKEGPRCPGDPGPWHVARRPRHKDVARQRRAPASPIVPYAS